MMGMTPYGTPKYLEKIKMHLGYRSGDPLSLVVPEYMYVQGKIDLRRQEMVEILEIEDPSILNDDTKDSFIHKANIASSAQAFTELVILDLVTHYEDLMEECDNNLVMAGGVALNCVMVRRIYDKYRNNIHVPSSPGDSGSSIGAALSYLWSNGIKEIHDTNRRTRELIYSGTKCNEETLGNEIECLCIENGLRAKSLEDSLEEITNRISNYEIGAWVEGRSEFGPRALCSRSIICRHDDVDMKRKLNLRIKNRENFRPFAGVFTEEQAKRIFDLMYEEQADGKKVNKMHYTMNTIALAKNTYNPKLMRNS